MRCASCGSRRSAVSGSRRASCCVQRRPAQLPRHGVDHEPDRRIGFRQVREPVLQRLEIQHGAAHEQRHAAGRGDARHQVDCLLAELRRGKTLGRVEDVDQVMRCLAPRAGVRLRGADVHAAIYLRRIDVDNLDREALRDRERHRGLAARRGTHEEEGGGSDCVTLTGTGSALLSPSPFRIDSYLPLMNIRSSSSSVTCRQVGRP